MWLINLAKWAYETFGGGERPHTYIIVGTLIFTVFGTVFGFILTFAIVYGNKQAKKREDPPTLTSSSNRSIKIGDRNIIKNSPMITGDVTVNPDVNPNAPVIIYDFNGTKHITSPGRISSELNREYDFFQQTLQPLRSQERWQELADACENEISRTPNWLTPYLYSAIALSKLGRKAEAIERLRFVDEKAAGNPDYSVARRMVGVLENE